jgi:hypothetical protein
MVRARVALFKRLFFLLSRPILISTTYFTYYSITSIIISYMYILLSGPLLLCTDHIRAGVMNFASEFFVRLYLLVNLSYLKCLIFLATLSYVFFVTWLLT